MAAVSLKPWPELLGREKGRMREEQLCSLIHFLSQRRRRAAVLDITPERSHSLNATASNPPRVLARLIWDVVSNGLENVSPNISHQSSCLFPAFALRVERFLRVSPQNVPAVRGRVRFFSLSSLFICLLLKVPFLFCAFRIKNQLLHQSKKEKKNRQPSFVSCSSMYNNTLVCSV